MREGEKCIVKLSQKSFIYLLRMVHEVLEEVTVNKRTSGYWPEFE